MIALADEIGVDLERRLVAGGGHQHFRFGRGQPITVFQFAEEGVEARKGHGAATPRAIATFHALTLVSDPPPMGLRCIAAMGTSDQEDDSDSPRRRTVSEQTLAARQAVQLVAPINERVGEWQSESVRLATAAQRRRDMGRDDAELGRDIRALLAKVEAELKSLDEAVLLLPPEVAANSRLVDTRRGLQIVAERLRAAQASA